MKKRAIYAVLIPLLVITACSQLDPPVNEQRLEPAPKVSEKVDEGVTVLVRNLNVPWSIVAEEDTFYVSERAGRIVKIKDGKVTRQKVSLTEPVLHHGEGGFLGLALDPDFKKNLRAYAYHTYRKNGAIYNRVVQLEETEEGWKERKILLDRIPGAAIHNGGRIKIGPDKKLYVTTGDANKIEDAQKKNNLAGKILRMDLNGQVPNDNPIPGSYIYSLGHRNPQGLTWADDGTLYSSEHGPTGNPRGHDEVNRIVPGGNYGWPKIIGDQTAPGMIPPLFHSGEGTWAPSGIAYHDQVLYVAGLKGEELRAFNLEDQSIKVILTNEGRLRDVIVKDDYLYILTNNGDGRGNPEKDDDRLLRVHTSTFQSNK